MKFKSLVLGFVVIGSLFLGSKEASAQPIAAPTKASVSAPDLSNIVSVHLNFYQCSGYSGTGNATVGTGCSATPFQSGVDIPVSNVTNLAVADQFGNKQQLNLTQAPISGYLSSTPLGVPFVAALQLVGDQIVKGTSALSAVSNPLVSGKATPATPTGLVLF